MRVGHLQPTRPEWFDRNPAIVFLTIGINDTNNHGEQVASSLTIPSGVKAYIDSAFMEGIRKVDGAPNNRTYCGLRLNNGAQNSLLMMIDTTVSNYGPVGDQWIGQAGIVLPGNVLTFVTYSTFLDGLIEWEGSVKVTTFDA